MILDSNVLHCKDCIVELESEHECDVCIENAKPKKTGLKNFIEPFFERQVKEMIRDIVAMANHRGGLILIGVEEGGDGVASGVPGIEGAGHVERITSSVQANIAPRLRGLNVVPIPLASGRAVIAVEIPESLSAPHMVTFQGENRFWRRHVRQKAMMSVDEIEASFMKKFEGISRVEEFLSDRRDQAAHLPEGRQWLMLQAVPVLGHEEIVDIRDGTVRDLLRRAPTHPQAAGWHCDAGTPAPSLHGLRSEHRLGGQLNDYLELRREGYMEFGTCYRASLGSETPNLVASTVVFGLTYSFIHLHAQLLQHLGVSTPVILALTIFNVRDAYLALSHGLSASLEMRQHVWRD
ncbi:MAG: ATP-binding protein, partial [Thaumarchaeota archaeon]|nr:ATP-binding protein [Nitrososphaerota archaeon]